MKRGVKCMCEKLKVKITFSFYRVPRDGVCLRHFRCWRGSPGGGSVQSWEVEVVWLRHESERESQELGVGRMQSQRRLWGTLLQEIFGFKGKTFKRYTRQN